MRLDVTELLKFYDTPLGLCACQAIGERLRSLWGDLSGLDVLGLGYAPPFLEEMPGTPQRMVSLMPAVQGGHAWGKSDKGSATVISEDDRLPFMDALFDRILIVHAIEDVAHIPTFLREIWRVSAPEARIVIIAPNRAGIWSLNDKTPFGYGRPFSRRQLKVLMRDSLIEPTAWTRSLYTPPLNHKVFTASSEGWERFGETIFANLGGVNLVEGTKRVQIEPNSPVKARVVVPGRAQLGLKSKTSCEVETRAVVSDQDEPASR